MFVCRLGERRVPGGEAKRQKPRIGRARRPATFSGDVG